MFKWQGNVTTSSQLRRGSTTKGNFTHYRLAGEAGHAMTCNVQNAYCLLKCERLVIWESFCCVKYTLYLKFLWNIYPTQLSDDEGTPPNLKCSSATTNGNKMNDQYKQKFREWLQKKWETFRSTTAHTLSPFLFFFAGHLMLVLSNTAVRVSNWFLDFLIPLLVSFTLAPFALFTTECILSHSSVVIYFFKMQINEESCLALSLYQHDT